MQPMARVADAPLAAPTMRTAAPGRLRSLLMDGDPVLLLGAGASITSGIPAADKTVEKVARWAWCKEHGRHPDDFTIRRSDYWPWLTAQPWYKEKLYAADLYPDAIDHLLGVKEPLINLRIMAYCAFDSRAAVWTGS